MHANDDQPNLAFAPEPFAGTATSRRTKGMSARTSPRRGVRRLSSSNQQYPCSLFISGRYFPRRFKKILREVDGDARFSQAGQSAQT